MFRFISKFYITKNFFFKIFRIGHAVCLNNEQITYLLKNPIPIEICPTSNLVTNCVKNIDEHPFFEFYSKNQFYPLTICTDDCGE